MHHVAEEPQILSSISNGNAVPAEAAVPKTVLPSSCAQALGNGQSSGVYLIDVPYSDMKPFYVYCLHDPQKNGSAWTLLMRRQDGSTDFYRDWQSYKHGFGNLENEFWLGLEYIKALTMSTKRPPELWINLRDLNNKNGNAYYSSFGIGSETTKYTLKIIGSYRGNVGDSLSKEHQGMQFATKDRNLNTLSKSECSKMFKGGWWYNNCHTR